MRYLPSKKFIIALVVGLVVLAGFFFYKFEDKKNDSLANVLQDSFLEDIGKMAEEKDADADGLKDWEEVLWGTDINNSDTDKDGYSDKQEADNGYDALDSLSNEKTGKKGEPKEFSIPDVSANINFTQELAKTAGSQVFQAGTSGSQLDISSSLNFLDEDVNKELAEYIASFNPRISEKELKISSDNSKEAVGKYIQEFIQAQLPIPYDDSGQTLSDIINESTQTKDFKKLDEFMNYFDQTIGNLKNLATPSDFLAVHKKKIELLISTKKMCEAIREVDRDPLKTILALQQFKRIGEETEVFLISFSKLIQK